MHRYPYDLHDVSGMNQNRTTINKVNSISKILVCVIFDTVPYIMNRHNEKKAKLQRMDDWGWSRSSWTDADSSKMKNERLGQKCSLDAAASPPVCRSVTRISFRICEDVRNESKIRVFLKFLKLSDLCHNLNWYMYTLVLWAAKSRQFYAFIILGLT